MPDSVLTRLGMSVHPFDTPRESRRSRQVPLDESDFEQISTNYVEREHPSIGWRWLQTFTIPTPATTQQILKASHPSHTPQDERIGLSMSIRGKYFADADTVHSVLTFHGLWGV
jgi:hypothetical protein